MWNFWCLISVRVFSFFLTDLKRSENRKNMTYQRNHLQTLCSRCANTRESFRKIHCYDWTPLDIEPQHRKQQKKNIINFMCWRRTRLVLLLPQLLLFLLLSRTQPIQMFNCEWQNTYNRNTSHLRMCAAWARSIYVVTIDTHCVRDRIDRMSPKKEIETNEKTSKKPAMDSSKSFTVFSIRHRNGNRIFGANAFNLSARALRSLAFEYQWLLDGHRCLYVYVCVCKSVFV